MYSTYHLNVAELSVEFLHRIQAGERLILTYQGKPIARLEPVSDDLPEADDPFYRLDQLADQQGISLENQEIDGLVYGR